MATAQFRLFQPPETDRGDAPRTLSVEIFVQPRFSQLELSSVNAVLEVANDVQDRVRFEWSFVSDMPGLVANGNFMVRAEPAIEAEFLKDCMIIIGGEECAAQVWMKRVRAMQRLNRPVVLFSDAATEFVKACGNGSQPATTHWRDIPILNEIGDFATLTTHLGEYGNGTLTCAGRGHAMEAVFTLVSDLLGPHERAEMAALLILDGIRGFHRDQPKGHAQGNTFLEGPVKRAIHLMEETIEEPLPITELVKRIGVSSRQLERLFRIQLGSSPAKTYKMIRLKRARSLLTETRMPMIDVALACGFASVSSMSKAFRQAFGMPPNSLRTKQRASE